MSLSVKLSENCLEKSGRKNITLDNFKNNLRVCIYLHTRVFAKCKSAQKWHPQHRIKELCSPNTRLKSLTAHLHAVVCFDTKHTLLQSWCRPDWSKDPTDTPLSTIQKIIVDQTRDQARANRACVAKGHQTRKSNNKYCKETTNPLKNKLDLYLIVWRYILFSSFFIHSFFHSCTCINSLKINIFIILNH